MQFEPSTFRQHDTPVPPGGIEPPSPYDPVDAVYAAARMLCADGAGDPPRLRTAIYDYNHSDSYVDEVMQLAGSLTEDASTISSVDRRGRSALVLAGRRNRSGELRPRRGGYAVPYGAGSRLVWPSTAPGWSRRRGQRRESISRGWLRTSSTPVLSSPRGLHWGRVTWCSSDGQEVLSPTWDWWSMHRARWWTRLTPVRSCEWSPFPVTVGDAWGGDVYVGATRPGAGTS